ncbi:winged helix-turn-helix transcriptional regulator [Bradyrhizobium ivorense]|uniref:winged helix-turn-helix transcriptional regulator n=1 Tax=Bradyrhizobium ivorense TaxID=2511166 RepID=UPI0010B3BD2F|nr:helix-turn-helix domain-containing protein [Bradyrhizobium ivorense]VIO73364.1 putative HTH-type transcriptional regulator [Bradyrhizobium ivorense]
MQRTGFANADCPVARALDAIGDWWSLLIVRDAFDGLRRFGDFQKNLGIAKGMLTARLRKLVELGVLEQVAASDGSAYQEYALTKKGHALFPVVVSLRQWGEANLFARGEPHSVLVDAQGERVGQLVLPSKAGRPLAWSETRVRKVAARRR